MAAASILSFDDVLSALSRHPGTWSVRILHPDESLPDWTNLPTYPSMDRDWIWVVDGPDGIAGILLAAGCHGMVFILRLQMRPGVSRHLLVPLLRKSIADWQERGYKGYVTILDPENPAEEQLMRIVHRAGGALQGKGLVFSGLIDDARRY